MHQQNTNVKKLVRGQHKVDFIEEGRDFITLLSRVFGCPHSNHFETWMLYFIHKIWNKKQFDWASIINNYLHEQLIDVLHRKKFYMTSYLVFLLALQNIFLGINKNDRFGEVQPGVYNFFPQLEMIESEKHFCNVNDGFTFTIIRRLHDEMERRISNEAANEIAKYGNWYIQF